jgi:hypothetical protein
MMALKGDPDSADRLARKDLPADVADNNVKYYRMIASAAKGAPASPASTSVPVAGGTDPMPTAQLPTPEAPTVR